jgi:putative two-component system response regulator
MMLKHDASAGQALRGSASVFASKDSRVAKLLVVDDDDALRHWAERALGDQGYDCEGAGCARDARECLSRNSFELVVLDVNMPDESGMELLAHIRSSCSGTAVLMVTGEDDPQLAMRAIEQGAYGYMVKPVRSGELLINVANALHRRKIERENERLMEGMRTAMDDRSQRLQQTLRDLKRSQNKVLASDTETIFRLARLVEFRDEETGVHLHRMSSYCEILAREMGLTWERCELVRLASQLHDVGKIATPDQILHKRGKLTAEEFEVIKAHAQAGFEMLADSAAEVVRLGALIARTHHEHWDGNGYPRRLSGGDIPLEGRLAAVADVFDALTTDRVYRPAFPIRFAINSMIAERATHFDPSVLDAFIGALPQVETVRLTYVD